jgi:hypothetical protein
MGFRSMECLERFKLCSIFAGGFDGLAQAFEYVSGVLKAVA